jgi:diguanylate cyclase (GGDEF)-like protein
MSFIDAGSYPLPSFLVATVGEEALLRRYGPCIAPRRRAFAERWVALLQQEPSLRSLLRKAFLMQARELMESHYAALLCADYGAERRAALQHAGAGYQQMGLPIHWITLSYGLLTEDFEIGVEALCLTSELSRSLRHALCKRLQLDMFWLEEGFQQAAAQRAASREVFYLAITQVNRMLTHPQPESSVEEILFRVVSKITKILQAPLVWIGIAPHGQSLLSIVAAAGPAASSFADMRVSVDPDTSEGNGPSGRAIRSGQPYVCHRDDPVMAPWRDLAVTQGIEGFAGAPFYFGDGDRGIVSIYRRDSETFPEDIVGLISHLAEDLGAFLDRRKTALELTRLRRYQKVLEILQQEMLRQPAPEILYQRLAQVLMEYTDALGVVVWMVKAGSEWLQQAAVAARSKEREEALLGLRVSLNPDQLPYGQMAAARVYHAAAPLVIEDVQKDQGIRAGWGEFLNREVQALGGWPIFAGGGLTPVAVLMVESTEANYFSPALQNLLNQLAGSIHIALDEYHSRQQLAAERESHAWQAHHDCLTGLPNRLGLARRLGDAMARALRHERLLGVGMLDLDDFKAINDAHGHAMGDRLLMDLAGRLKQALRHTDFAARLGGDEFVLVLEDLRDLGDLETIIAKVGEALELPFSLAEGLTIQVRGSLGLTVFPLDDSDADLLLRHADQALYVSKAAKEQRNQYWSYYNDAMDQCRKTGRALRSLLSAGGLRVFYQPVLDLASNHIVGIEALARLENSEGAILLPKEFLPQFNPEDQRTLTQLMLSQAIVDLTELDKAGHALWVSVNVTPELLLSGTCLRCLDGILAAGNIDPSRIVLEILEGSDFLSMDEARERILDIKALGVRVALDDIGSAYSSLLRLKDLPIDEIKLDQAFVHTLKVNPNGLHFIQTLLDLSRSLRVDFVAEGCETADVLDALKVLNVPMVQGYAIAPAMPIDVLHDWLRRSPPLREDSLYSLLGIFAHHLAYVSLIQGLAVKNPQWLAGLPLQDALSSPVTTAIAALGLAGTTIDIAHHAYHRVLEATIKAFRADGAVDWTAAEDAASFFQQVLLNAIRETNGHSLFPKP